MSAASKLQLVTYVTPIKFSSVIRTHWLTEAVSAVNTPRKYMR